MKLLCKRNLTAPGQEPVYNPAMKRESLESLKRRIGRITEALRRAYPEARCALDFSTPFELLAATVLSAQCTDKRVNLVTPALFRRCRSVADYAAIGTSELEVLVRSTGFYKNKAKNIQGAARGVLERFGGEVPQRMEDLISLPGVGRKTANVILGNAFGIPGIPVDTHMIRINRLLGLTRQEDPVKIEFELMELLPRKDWSNYTHWIIHHGRACCIARRPECSRCPVAEWCPSSLLQQRKEKRTAVR